MAETVIVQVKGVDIEVDPSIGLDPELANPELCPTGHGIPASKGFGGGGS